VLAVLDTADHHAGPEHARSSMPMWPSTLGDRSVHRARQSVRHGRWLPSVTAMNAESTRNVVARYANGKIAKGHTFNFGPNKPFFHLFPAEGTATKALGVWLKDLKAVFFVRSFAGDPDYTERKDLDPKLPPLAAKVRVEFLDGEVLVGYTTAYNPMQLGFFFVPMDPNGNNVRVFAVFSAASSVTVDSTVVWSNSTSPMASLR
jgi:hypothetical protein